MLADRVILTARAILAARAPTAICPPNPANPDQAQLLSSGNSVHDVLRILAIVGTAATGMMTCGLILTHLLRYRIPNEQRQIIRLVAVPFIYAISALLQICFYNAAEYLRPLADLYEAFALASILMLFCYFAEPHSANRSQVMQNRSKSYSPKLFKHVWVLVFQYPFVRIITTIVTEASLATGRFCARSNSPQFASIWMTIIQSLSVALAVGSVIRFYKVVKPEMVSHHPLLKLVAFKIVVFLSFIINLIFNILNARGVLKSSTYVSYYDLSRGIPAIIICLASVAFSVLNLFAFRSREYSDTFLLQRGDESTHWQNARNSDGSRKPFADSLPPKVPLAEAVLSALNPRDIIEGFGSAIRILTG